MGKLDEKKCQICFKEESMNGAVWCQKCYFKQVDKGFIGSAAQEEFKRMKKEEIDLTPRLRAKNKDI